MRWLAECSSSALAAAVRAVAPELGECSIVLSAQTGKGDPLWWSSSAVLDGRFIAKFAWSQPAALRIAHEINVLNALSGLPFLPEVVAYSTDPLLLITRLVLGSSLFEVADSIDRDRAGAQLGRFLVTLHQPSTRGRVETAVGPLPSPRLPAATSVLREQFGKWIRADQRGIVERWYDWADATLATPRPTVLVHADLHGDNQVWNHGELRVVVDFETVSAAEPEYDLRAFPGTGPGVDLLTATMRHYEQITGHQLSTERVMAWHLRNAIGDALWRSEAGIPLPDHRTPTAWVDDISTRLSALNINPSDNCLQPHGGEGFAHGGDGLDLDSAR